MKQFFKFLFSSLFSNIEALKGKKQPFWAALIVAFISLGLAIIPTSVTMATQKGANISSLTTTSNHSLDTSLALFSKHLQEKDEKGKLVNYVKVNDGKLDIQFTEYVAKDSKNNTLMVIGHYENEKEIDDFEKKCLEYFTYESEIYNATGPVSYMLITDKYVYINMFEKDVENVYKQDKKTKEYSFSKYATAASTYQGDLSALKDADFSSYYVDKVGGKNDCTNAWAKTLNDMYKPFNQKFTLLYSLIITGLNLGVLVIVTIMLFILTKLKSNQGEVLTFVEAFKISCFAALAPAILTAALGFVMQFLTMIGFVLFLGLRSTFLGMKATSPIEQTTGKK